MSACENVSKRNSFRQNSLKRVMLIFLILMIMMIQACSCEKSDTQKLEDVQYSIVTDSEIPLELKKLIKDKKAGTIKLVFVTENETYITAGYGTLPTNGYSIRVKEIYRTKNGIIADFELMGPSEGDKVTQLPSMPYIVIKIKEKTENADIKL